MAQKSETEYRRTAIACPKHGSTHIQRLVMPEPGDYFAAFYACHLCAVYEMDRLTAVSMQTDAARVEMGPEWPACDCERQMWQRHTDECAISRAYRRPYEPQPERTHPIGCVCETCSAAYERDAWDPRMGER
jgi:hypothetical protein